MKIGAALSTLSDPSEAATEAASAARDRLAGEAAALAVLVASRHHAPAADAVLEATRTAAGAECVIACVAESVVGGAREVEGGPAVSVWLAALPEPPETFHLQFVRTTEGGVLAGHRFGSEMGPYLLIGDPFSFPMDLLLTYVNERAPSTAVMGGMASGGLGPGETRLFLDDRVLEEGAVAARLPGVRIRSLVSQGCRPIGNVYTVTHAEGSVIHELGGNPPLARVEEMVHALSPEDRLLARRGLHLGRVIDPYKSEFARGDFLVRGVIRADPDSGAIAVGDRIEVGESVQFHVRDAATADEDLRELRNGRPPRRPQERCCSPATDEGPGCSPCPTTMRRSCPSCLAGHRSPGSTAPERSARWAARTSGTASPHPWHCSPRTDEG